MKKEIEGLVGKKMKPKKITPIAGMSFLLILTQLLGIYMSSFFVREGLQAFPDPESMFNPLYILVLILGFTAFFLFMGKLDIEWIIEIFIGFAIFLTLIYVFMAIIGNIFSFGLLDSLISALAPTLILLFLILFYREWYIINIVGILASGGIAAIFGSSLGTLPVIIFLVILAVYDAVAVYKTKHMIELADSAMKMRLPVMFVIPHSKKFSLKDFKPSDKEGEKKAWFLGLGDAVMPSILTVSAFVFSGTIPAFGAFFGSIVGAIFLGILASTGKPHAGLPLLNGGTISGYILFSVLVLL